MVWILKKYEGKSFRLNRYKEKYIFIKHANEGEEIRKCESCYLERFNFCKCRKIKLYRVGKTFMSWPGLSQMSLAKLESLNFKLSPSGIP